MFSTHIPPLQANNASATNRNQFEGSLKDPQYQNKNSLSFFGTTLTECTTALDNRGRSAALERAYVHDVYENCDESQGPIKPRVAQFLAALEPGSLICDVGCGNGRYLTSCNPLICAIGADRCYRLTKIAQNKGGMVALSDNLELPFRDESFDAVLSLAVVHHFATTERRVRAIKELARILRIGGRVIITVWALEQQHNQFESQDVLIPLQPPKQNNQNYSDEDDDEEFLPPYNAYTEDSTNSSRSAGDGDSSSLSSSSPGESCYSFVRRALQKLTAGRRNAWFLDSWPTKDTKIYENWNSDDVKDLPIELRRLEDLEDISDGGILAGIKSRSLGNILNLPPQQKMRSLSSVPNLGINGLESKPLVLTETMDRQAQFEEKLSVKIYSNTNSIEEWDSSDILNPNIESILNTKLNVTQSDQGISSPFLFYRPKLTKQNRTFCEEDNILTKNLKLLSEASYNENNKSCFSNPRIYFSSNRNQLDPKLYLWKQNSLNEELMAGARLREKEKVKKQIQKQVSLNETYLYRPCFSNQFQIIRENFKTKFKISSESFERTTKTGFVKIMQNFKTKHIQSDISLLSNSINYNSKDVNQNKKNVCTTIKHKIKNKPSNNFNKNCEIKQDIKKNEDEHFRQHSHESGSDSSKESGLQSDTSVESEDSFASVIFIPNPEKYNQNHNKDTTSIANNDSNSGTQQCEDLHFTSSIDLTNSNSSIIATAKKKLFSHRNDAHELNHIIQKYKFSNMHTNLYSTSYGLTSSIIYIPTHALANLKNKGTYMDIENCMQKQDKDAKLLDLSASSSFHSETNIAKFAFPFIRNSSTTISTPELFYLDMYNPEIDDIDSDSSAKSSPDSMTSFISSFNVKSVANNNDSVQKNFQQKIKSLQFLDDNNIRLNKQYNSENRSNLDFMLCSKQSNVADQYLSQSKVVNCVKNTFVDLDKTVTKFRTEINNSDLNNYKFEHIKRYLTDINYRNEQLLINFNLNNHYNNVENCHLVKESSSHVRKFSGKNNENDRFLNEANTSFLSNNYNDTESKYSLLHENNIPSREYKCFNKNNETTIFGKNTNPLSYSIVVKNNNEVENNRNNDSHYIRENKLSKKKFDKCNTEHIYFEKIGSKNYNSLHEPENVDYRHENILWTHKSSSSSLDSPQGGGAATHHRYYHVFQEGELDALINHHVASLHIVSSYYEKASWCIIAEKVHVWTI